MKHKVCELSSRARLGRQEQVTAHARADHVGAQVSRLFLSLSHTLSLSRYLSLNFSLPFTPPFLSLSLAMSVCLSHSFSVSISPFLSPSISLFPFRALSLSLSLRLPMNQESLPSECDQIVFFSFMIFTRARRNSATVQIKAIMVHIKSTENEDLIPLCGRVGFQISIESAILPLQQDSKMSCCVVCFLELSL